MYQSAVEEIVKYHHCFVCGDSNPTGLKARFFFDGESANTEIEAGEAFEGYRGIYHGGIISTLLDEVMIKALLAKGLYTVTAELTVKFHSSVHTGDRIRFSGREIASRGRLHLTEGQAVNAAGDICASAKGKYLETDQKMNALLQQSLDQP
ncbi:MAG: PaaI family thioesterase [Candidatus Zixiibacteriota bacterium]|nr:MAG: PaaI family thioesterase [candidate division Zixibacteria bacterium]